MSKYGPKAHSRPNRYNSNFVVVSIIGDRSKPRTPVQDQKGTGAFVRALIGLPGRHLNQQEGAPQGVSFRPGDGSDAFSKENG